MQYQGQYTGAQIDAAVAKANNAIGQTINKTWSQLKAMRDGSTLVPGQWYRITDYTCTTTQANTQSAGHVFDIIVRADSTNVLNENAYAAKHSGDTYFRNCNLSAWKLKYTIDNDEDTYIWADEDGKGVVYWMKDEYGNECDYDFKNIQFKRWYVADSRGKRNVKGKYYGFQTSIFKNEISVPDTSNFIWAYTFSSSEDGGAQRDASINGNAINNIIKVSSREDLSNVVLFKGSSYPVANNIILSARNVSIGGSMSNFILCCKDVIIAEGFFYNFVGIGFESNIIGSSAEYNIIGERFANCSIMKNFAYNAIGNSFIENTIGNSFQYNNTGANVSNITTTGTSKNNTIGNNCNHINIQKSYVQSIIIENSNQYINVTSTQSTSSSNYLQNFTITQGVNNTTTVKTISHDTVNDTFRTVYQPANSQVVNV